MLELKNISKNFGDFHINNIDVDIDKGDYFVLLGVSGAGKSLLLEIIAGLISPDSGQIYLEGKDITRKRIQNREIGLVFQDYAIFPHLNVFDNIAYPLKSTKLEKQQIKEKVNVLAGQMNIAPLLYRKPGSLSGGELQRVALARILALNPKVLLLDEPLAALDVQLRSDLRGLLRRLNLHGQTILHVTHDYEEAISLASKVSVIHEGKIIQQGLPEKVFRYPLSQFVANFAGIKNFYKSTLHLEYSDCCRAEINEKVSFYLPECLEYKKGVVIIGSEEVTVSKAKLESTALNNFQGIIMETVPSLHGIEIIIDIGVDISAHISLKSYKEMGLSEGSGVWVSFKASAVRFIGFN